MRCYFPQFNINDSLKGNTPKRFFKEPFKYISKEALDLLKNRSIETIEFGALDINRIRKRKSDEIAIEFFRKGEKDFTLDADFENYEDHPCRCGSKNCVGYIVAEDQVHKLKKALKKSKILSRDFGIYLITKVF